jgi:hypothetical protein
MFCSGSESSQVEHLRPKVKYPHSAMSWDNFLWVCGICNLNKSEEFPLGNELINPMTENVWDYCFIDEYGNLSALWRPELDNVDPRGDITINLLRLDRDALQISRESRLLDLKQQVTDSLRLYRGGHLNLADLRARHAEWLRQPFQPDVADYFLAGPGGTDSPFKDLLTLLAN